ncbi:MAG: hypothetical protein WCF57_19955 [Pyrinomonadaceae bacterium]
MAKRFSVACGAIFAFLLYPSAALAQCAMCRAAAASAGNDAATTLNTAILVLLIPPVLIFCAIFIVAYRLRAAQGDEPRENPKEEWVSQAWLEQPNADATPLAARSLFRRS